MKTRRGVTLIEMIIFVSLWAILAVTTMQILGQTRIMRGNARDRSQMLLAAQQELDRLRTDNWTITEGTQTFTPENAPAGCIATREVTGFDAAHWQITIRVERPSSEGKPSVELATLVRREALP